MSAFVRELCDVGPGKSVTVETLFHRWKRWYVKIGRDNPGTEQVFGRDLRAALPNLTAKQRRQGDRPERYYDGIQLKVRNAV